MKTAADLAERERVAMERAAKKLDATLAILDREQGGLPPDFERRDTRASRPAAGRRWSDR